MTYDDLSGPKPMFFIVFLMFFDLYDHTLLGILSRILLYLFTYIYIY